MSESDTTVAVFVGTRADLGPLDPVVAALDAHPRVDLTVLTGVAYDVDELTATLPGDPAHWAGRVRALAPVMTTIDPQTQSATGAKLSAATAQALTDPDADVLVVLGDRWELLSVVPPAALLGVRIVHLHGGEVTEGAIDERIRHAVTKLADQHCVASADAAQRVAQLGEPAERIHVTGAPGLDRLTTATALTDDELLALVRRFAPTIPAAALTGPRALFTYHPPTVDRDAPVGAWAAQALAATAARCSLVVATHPGMDPGRDEVLAALHQGALDHPDRVVVIPALGADYPRMLHTVDVVVGNSSSGIIEAASAGRPAVDIGRRQQGRLRGSNVVTVDEGFEAVAAGLEQALDPAHVTRARHTVNPYGAGDAARRIVDVVVAAPSVSLVKPFVNHREVA